MRKTVSLSHEIEKIIVENELLLLHYIFSSNMNLKTGFLTFIIHYLTVDSLVNCELVNIFHPMKCIYVIFLCCVTFLYLYSYVTIHAINRNTYLQSKHSHIYFCLNFQHSEPFLALKIMKMIVVLFLNLNDLVRVCLSIVYTFF